MKKSRRLIALMAVISAMVMTLGARTISDHTARDGDHLHPGIAKSDYLILSVNDTTRTMLLDPTAVSFDDTKDAYSYVDGDTISYVQSATKHRFLLRGDTLSYLGYENRATHFRTDGPVRVAVFPLVEGGRISEVWSGSILHNGSMLLKHVKGLSASTVSDGWTLTDGADTVHNATLLKWRLDMAYANPDSILGAMPDSVAADRISDMQVDVKAMMSERLLTERTLWFTDKARYPVLTDSRVSRVIVNAGGASADTIPVSMLAMHYPASYQYSDTGEEPPARKSAADGAGHGHASDGLITIGEAESSGNSVSVTLSSPNGPSTATLTLYTDSGTRLTEPWEVIVGQVPQPYGVEVPSGWSGVILLRVDFGDESYTLKTIR